MSAAESGKFKGEENWRISLVNFTSFRSISFNFIPFHPAPRGPRPQGEGGGGDLSGQDFPHLAVLLTMVVKNNLDSPTLTCVFQPLLKADILFYRKVLAWVIEAHP